MKQLETELTGTDMQNIIAFNHTYLIITEAVADQLNKEFFNDDLLMEKFDIQFARYYFNALKKYVDRKVIPPSWVLLFDLSKQNKTYQFIYMALGVNAHVNNDLSQSLYDTISEESYRKDFDKVNTLIQQKIPLVVSSLKEDNTFVNTSKNILQPLYASLLYLLIKSWRKNAWDSYINLKSETLSKKDIEEHARKIGLIFTKFKKIV
jgi:hypothetical protein